MDKILITGCAGFLGSNLLEYLLTNTNNIIYGIDNFSSSRISTIYPFLKNDRFIFLEDDIRNNIDFEVDKVYHLASSGDLSRYFSNKYEYVFEQIEIIKNIFHYINNTGAKLIITQPFYSYNTGAKEKYMLYDMLNLITNMTIYQIKENNFDCKIARLAYYYGKNMIKEDKRLVNDTIIKALNNEDIELEFDEEIYATYVTDIIKALNLIMDNMLSRPIVDVSCGSTMRKSDIIKLIITFLKSQSKFKVNNPDLIKHSYKPDIELLNKELNFKCTTSILEGMSKTINFYAKKSNYRA